MNEDHPDIKVSIKCPRCKETVDHLICIAPAVCFDCQKQWIIKGWRTFGRDGKPDPDDSYKARIDFEDIIIKNEDAPPVFKSIVNRINNLKGYYCPKCKQKLKSDIDEIKKKINIKLGWME